MHKAVQNIPFGQQILSRISPIASYYHAFPELNDVQQFEWALLDTHDILTDWYKHVRNSTQIENTLKNLGAIDIHVEIAGNGVEARCRKPAI